MLAIDGAIFAVLRIYNRRGEIVGFPFPNTVRERSPRLFRFVMLFGWLSLALSLAFTALIAIVLLFG